jgi:hypothetical protein
LQSTLINQVNSAKECHFVKRVEPFLPCIEMALSVSLWMEAVLDGIDGGLTSFPRDNWPDGAAAQNGWYDRV